MDDWGQLGKILSEVFAFLAKQENFGPFVAGTAGAAFGAWGAQAAINKAQKRHEVVVELRSLVSAHKLTFSIINTFMSTKQQHVMPLMENLRGIKKSYETFIIAPKAPGYHPKFEFQADLQTFIPSLMPIEPLQDIIYEAVSLHGRGVVATSLLAQSIDSISQFQRDRNDIIKGWHSSMPSNEDLLAYLIEIDRGRGPETFYKTICEGMEDYTDDCIYFSSVVLKEVEKRGMVLRRRYRWRYWGLPTLPVADLSDENTAKLIPPDSNYDKWNKGFVTAPTFYQRVIRSARTNWHRRFRRNN